MSQVSIVIRLNVADFDNWLNVFNEYADFRARSGVKGEDAYQSSDDPNDLIVVAHLDSLEDARALISSDELKAAMQKVGATSPPTIWIGSRVAGRPV